MSKGNHNLYLNTAIGFAGLTAVCGGFLFSISASADDVVDQIEINIPVSCSMTGEGMDSHVTSLNNNETDSDFGATDVNVTCNDGEGFAIYAVGFTDDTEGKTVLTDSTLGSTQDIVTGTATSGATSNWAMKLTTSPSATYPISIQNNYNTFQSVPSTYTMVAKRESATDIGASAEGANFTTSYQVYIGTNQIAGTYEGQVKYVLVHPNDADAPLSPQPATAGCINYFPNGSNVDGTMGCQSATDGQTKVLLASNFSRTGYGFAGWSNKYDYATSTASDLKFYGPQETITVPAGTTANGLSLYAVWVKSAGSLQDTSKVASVCSSLTTAPTDGTANLSSVSALTDQRDNNTYAIAKLADGNCWMIENLRLESTNSDNSTGNLSQGYGTSATFGNFGGLATAESSKFYNITAANSLYYSGTQSGTASINIGTTNLPGSRMPRYNNLNTSTRASNPTNNDGNMYSYGNYYTWHAAIADLTYNGTDNQSTTGTSLCPAGWHLPTGGSASASGSTSGVNVTGDTSTFREFYNLGYKTMDEVKTAYEDTPNSGYAYYSSNTTNTAGKTATAAFRSFPNNFLYSGFFDMSSAKLRGSYGYYWSSTANGNYGSYHLSLDISRVSPGTNTYDKYLGLSIRCTVGS